MMALCVKHLLNCKRFLILLATPLLLLPLPLVIRTKEASCAYTIMLMAVYWCTEVIPLAVTALMPVLLFPMFGILESKQVCMQYLKDTNMLFVGGLIVAVAVEHWNLHKRIALKVLLIVGVKPPLLMLGFMGVTAFLSMWISNTATTAMMVPIVQAVLSQLSNAKPDSSILDSEGQTNPGMQLDEKNAIPMTDVQVQDCAVPFTVVANGHTQDMSIDIKERKEKKRINKGMMLSVCYAASIGGTATLTGTGPNLVLKGQLSSIFPNNGDILNFASWFGFACPNMIVMLCMAWFWLQFSFMGLKYVINVITVMFNIQRYIILNAMKGKQKDSKLKQIKAHYLSKCSLFVRLVWVQSLELVSSFFPRHNIVFRSTLEQQVLHSDVTFKAMTRADIAERRVVFSLY